jgi:hypothetical protein
MCSHYQSLKDTELPLQKFGAPNEPAGGKYDMCRAAGGYQVPPGRRGKADDRHPAGGRLRRMAHCAGRCDTTFSALPG